MIDTLSEVSTYNDIPSMSSSSFGSSKSSAQSSPLPSDNDIASMSSSRIGSSKGSAESSPRHIEVHTDCSMVNLIKTFQLPTNYSPQVEASLKEKSMTTASTRMFVTAIARAMYAVKRYPTSEEFDFIGRHVIEKYPFLRCPIGNGYGHLVVKLKQRFKNF